MDNAGKNQVINAQVPMAEFLSYASDLRSMTGGRGMFTMEFSHYDEVPAQIAEKIIEEANRSKEFSAVITVLKSIPGIADIWACIIAAW